MQWSTIAPTNGGDTKKEDESMSCESIVASVRPWFETKPSGRVTGRRSKLQPSTWKERSAPEEKLQGTTVILVAVPAASALISSLPQPGTRAKRIIPPGQVARPTYPLLFHSAAFCLRSTKISCELDISSLILYAGMYNF